MEKLLLRCNRYIQGRDILSKASIYIGELGHNALVLADGTVWKIAGNNLAKNLQINGLRIKKVIFNGEYSNSEISRITDLSKRAASNVIVGIGGGKTMDTAKAVASHLNLKLTTIPTKVSVDAFTTIAPTFYADKENIQRYRFHQKHPDLVLVDTHLIAKAPTRFLVSAIVNSLAILTVARTIEPSNHIERAKHIILTDGIEAFEANQNRRITPALERVIEAKAISNGLRHRIKSLDVAHLIYKALSMVPTASHRLTHDEKVAYSTIMQLVLQNESLYELDRYIKFYLRLGLSLALKDILLESTTKDELLRIAEFATNVHETTDSYNLPFRIKPDEFVVALQGFDAYMTNYKKLYV